MAAGTVYVKRRGGAWILTLRGEHGRATRPLLIAELRRLLGTEDGVVVDMSEAERIDSTVIAAIIAARNEVDRDQRHRFAILVPRTGAIATLVASIVGLDRVIPTVAHLETAIRSVTTPLRQQEAVT